MKWLRGLSGSIRRRGWALTVAGLWSLLVLGALLSTLSSLRHDEFDGTNNILQLPLAFPWFFINGLARLPVEHYTHWAYLDACYGWLNGAIIYTVFQRQDNRTLDGRYRSPTVGSPPEPPDPA